MKAVVLALVVALVVSQGEALRCRCGGLRQCTGPVETCFGNNNVCISAIIYAGSNINRFSGCYELKQCLMLNRPGISSASCCMRDLCN